MGKIYDEEEADLRGIVAALGLLISLASMPSASARIEEDVSRPLRLELMGPVVERLLCAPGLSATPATRSSRSAGRRWQ